MERIKSLLFIILFVLVLEVPVFADVPMENVQLITLPQCVKTFNLGYQKLFLLTETAIVNSSFEVEEIQSQGGYIVFSVNGRKFLATVFTFGTNKAILKITPCNNNYSFSPTVIKNIFRYIEANQYKKF